MLLASRPKSTLEAGSAPGGLVETAQVVGCELPGLRHCSESVHCSQMSFGRNEIEVQIPGWRWQKVEVSARESWGWRLDFARFAMDSLELVI